MGKLSRNEEKDVQLAFRNLLQNKEVTNNTRDEVSDSSRNYVDD